MSSQCYRRIITRRKPKILYQYINIKSGKPVTNPDLLHSLNEIKVPATYEDVEICPNRKLQATGYDQTGRKQYFYSERHQQRSARQKYCTLIHLGHKLPKILKDINRLVKKGEQGQIDGDILDALALRVMILCNFRVGNSKNLKNYKTYGLTTITKDHLKLSGGRPRSRKSSRQSKIDKSRKRSSSPQAHIKFNGKKQMVNECVIKDPKTVQFLKRLSQHRDKLNKSSSQKLFQYKGYTVTPESLNSFLQQYNPELTTKTWRTWFANIQYIERISRRSQPKSTPYPPTKTSRTTLSNGAIAQIAKSLHHTPAINKRNYLIPELRNLFIDRPNDWIKLERKHRDSNPLFLDFLKGYCDKN